jgi:pSer/pThr/pTyr-binding forkhead associated (FHA) protein
MPWIHITANGEELDRRELTADAAIVIGRSPECDVAVRDILLSRTHCRIEPAGKGGWKLLDLNSKNGTRVGWQKVQTHLLRDGDHLRMGRTRITYHLSQFEPAPARPPRNDRLVRPADPHEALSGTVTDFVLLDEEEKPSPAPGPFPQPRPFEPAAPVLEPETESLLDELASSYWSRENDTSSASLTAIAPATAIARTLPKLKAVRRQIRAPISQAVDISLQADASNLTPLPAITPERTTPRQRLATTAALTLAALAGTAIVLMSLWLLTIAP